MRLIHYQPDQEPPLSLVEFLGKDIPRYAILSHTWGEEEVSFKDMKKNRAEGMKGLKKIKGLCEVAAGDGFEYMWVDTCCKSFKHGLREGE